MNAPPTTISPFTEDAMRLGRAISELTERNASLLDQLGAMDRAFHIAQAEISMLREALARAADKADFYSRYAVRLHTQFTSLSHDALLINSRIHALIDSAKAEAYAPKLPSTAADEVGPLTTTTQLATQPEAEGPLRGEASDSIPKFLLTSLEDKLRQINTQSKDPAS